MVRFFNLHLVSDSTGETLGAVSRAVCAQYTGVRPKEQRHVLVRTSARLAQVFEGIEEAPGVVMYTIVNAQLRQELERRCRDLNLPHVAILDPALHVLRAYLGKESAHLPGAQHLMDSAYFQRIEALDYTIAHDDGQRLETLAEADVILLGVSRTGKTPTCIYLAHRGVKAANVPVVKGQPLPQAVIEARRPLVVGLTVSWERLVQVRRHRLSRMPAYVAQGEVTQETTEAKSLFARHGWPVLDVTRHAVEETAAAVMELYKRHLQAGRQGSQKGSQKGSHTESPQVRRG